MPANKYLQDRAAEMMRGQTNVVELMADYVRAVLAEVAAPGHIVAEADRMLGGVISAVRNAEDASAFLFREFNSRLAAAEIQLAAVRGAGRPR